jgi:aminoglycoside phosphotransferase (APT) family kinase protein
VLSIIPESKRAAAIRAIEAAFGRSAPDAIMAVGGGLSAAGAYRMVADGRAFLLRLDGPSDALRDPARWQACMRIAAEAGVAPAVTYADAVDGVIIVDFIAAQPPTSARDRRRRLAAMATSLRTLHATERFPPLVDHFDGVQALLELFQERRLFAPLATAELIDRFGALARTYRRDPADLVSSHNDLNPGNIIYAQERVWFVDWEAAFLADRFVDLSSLANWFCRDEAEETQLLSAYFGGEPSARSRARLTLMRAVNRLFLGVMFANVAGAELPGLGDLALEGPNLAALIGPGGPALGTPQDRLRFGSAQLRQAIEDFGSARFAEALAAA